MAYIIEAGCAVFFQKEKENVNTIKKLVLAPIAMLALATTAAHASSADITRWENLNEKCVYSIKLSDEERELLCATADRLREKLLAQGYCTYGHGEVGRSSRDKKHCYARVTK